MRLYLKYLFIIVTLNFVCKTIEAQKNGSFIINLYDSETKLKIKKIDSLLLINSSDTLRFINLSCSDKNFFLIKNINQGNYKIKIYNFRFEPFENNCKITSIPNSDNSTTLKKKDIKFKTIKYEFTPRDYKSETLTVPSPYFKNGLEGLVGFIHENINNSELKLKKYDILNINFKVDSIGKPILIDVLDNMNNKIDTVTKSEINRIINLLPNWEISKNSHIAFVIYSLIYEL